MHSGMNAKATNIDVGQGFADEILNADMKTQGEVRRRPGLGRTGLPAKLAKVRAMTGFDAVDAAKALAIIDGGNLQGYRGSQLAPPYPRTEFDAEPTSVFSSPLTYTVTGYRNGRIWLEAWIVWAKAGSAPASVGDGTSAGLIEILPSEDSGTLVWEAPYAADWQFILQPLFGYTSDLEYDFGDRREERPTVTEDSLPPIYAPTGIDGWVDSLLVSGGKLYAFAGFNNWNGSAKSTFARIELSDNSLDSWAITGGFGPSFGFGTDRLRISGSNLFTSIQRVPAIVGGAALDLDSGNPSLELINGVAPYLQSNSLAYLTDNQQFAFDAILEYNGATRSSTNVLGAGWIYIAQAATGLFTYWFGVEWDTGGGNGFWGAVTWDNGSEPDPSTGGPWTPSVTGGAAELAPQDAFVLGNDIFVCGDFTGWDGNSRAGVVKLNANKAAPTVDLGFNPLGVTGTPLFNRVVATADYVAVTDGTQIYIWDSAGTLLQNFTPAGASDVTALAIDGIRVFIGGVQTDGFTGFFQEVRIT